MRSNFCYPYYEMYGRVRYFVAEQCMNEGSLREFNKNKIQADELVTFDCALMVTMELSEYSETCDAKQMMAVIIRPDLEPYDRLLNKGFEFCGYDLVEMGTCISAITNCGAEFELAIKYEELNQFGLIEDYRDAVATQFALRDNYADESHAYCEIVEIWRKR